MPGLEEVMVIGWEDDVLPHGFNHSYKGIDEERKLAYVAVTRAKTFDVGFAEKRHGHEKEYSVF